MLWTDEPVTEAAVLRAFAVINHAALDRRAWRLLRRDPLADVDAEYAHTVQEAVALVHRWVMRPFVS